MTLKIRSADFTTISRSKSLDEATDVTDSLWASAAELFETWSAGRIAPVRLIGVGVSQLSTEELMSRKQDNRDRQSPRYLSEAKRKEIPEPVRHLQSSGEDSAFDCALASEAVLAKDWLSPEEDEAWRDL